MRPAPQSRGRPSPPNSKGRPSPPKDSAPELLRHRDVLPDLGRPVSAPARARGTTAPDRAPPRVGWEVLNEAAAQLQGVGNRSRSEGAASRTHLGVPPMRAQGQAQRQGFGDGAERPASVGTTGLPAGQSDRIVCWSGEPSEQDSERPSKTSASTKSTLSASTSTSRRSSRKGKRRDPRRYVRAVLSTYPFVKDELGMNTLATQTEVIDKLMSVESPAVVLQEAGMDSNQASQVCKVLEEVAQEEPERIRWSRKEMVLGCCALFLICVGICFPLATFGIKIAATYGYEEGMCYVLGFTNETDGCADSTCSLTVNVRKRWSDRVVLMHSWMPPIEHDAYSSRQKIVGEPFRCCQGAKADLPSCCELRDEKTYRFCDQWTSKTDDEGEACPSGEWNCLFNSHVVSRPPLPGLPGVLTEEAYELIVYDPPPSGDLLVVGIVLAIVGLCALCATLVHKMVSFTERASNVVETMRSVARPSDGLVIKTSVETDCVELFAEPMESEAQHPYAVPLETMHVFGQERAY